MRAAPKDPLWEATSRAAGWISGNGSEAPRDTKDGVIFRLPFATTGSDRFFWDVLTPLDLSKTQTLRLEVTCPDPGSMRALTLYLESGDGWYVAASQLRGTGRQTLILNRSDFSAEGKPAGWNRIKRVRLSPWKGVPVDSQLVLHRLSAGRESIVLVEGDESLPNAAERRQAKELANRIAGWLADAGISHNRISDREMASGGLSGISVALLCYTAQLSDSGIQALRKYVQAGGKLIVFYSADARLAELMGVKVIGYRKTERPLQWASFAFPETSSGGFPERVFQESRNLMVVEPIARRARVVAWWEDGTGRRTKEAAWLESEHGYWMTHILLRGDRFNKQHLLAGLLSRYQPDVLREFSERSASFSTRIDGFPTLSALNKYLRDTGDPEILQLLGRAETLYRDRTAATQSGQYGESLRLSRDLRETLVRAYARAQPPLKPGITGVWDHNGVGWYPGDWNRSAALLSTNGINTIF
ncbi:MAG: hypothetical protein U1E27_07160, partial [Kiritimatiellia bacterium]|nr:hypothetical protein [Kiritimatiellia bacterium]